jgi:hypothetical protein
MYWKRCSQQSEIASEMLTEINGVTGHDNSKRISVYRRQKSVNGLASVKALYHAVKFAQLFRVSLTPTSS